MVEQLPENIKALILTKRGVGYYNKDNKDKENNKEKKNNYCDGCSTPHPTHNSDSSVSFGIAASAALETDSDCQVESLCSSEVLGLGSEIQDEIKTALLQLFDNGEQAKQRYKFKIRINLVDGSNPEFIANLTKDLRNFKKYIPEEGRQEVIQFAIDARKMIKDQTGFYPYIGKLHLTEKGTNKRTTEPNTAVAIWYDAEHKGWSGVLMFYDWIHKFDLFDQYLTDKQRAAGVKCQDTYTNPKHQKVRPLTWAERRKAGIK